MRWADYGPIAALLLAGLARADAPTYGKVETFQPGKKYNCVPTPDRKAWDCSESGRAAAQQQHDDATAAAPPSSPANPPPAELAPKASALPSYLTNRAASGRATTPAPAPAPAASPPATTASAPASASRGETKSDPSPSAQSSPAVGEKLPEPPAVATTVAKPAPAAPSSLPSAAQQPDNEFASLPGEQYVIELAHADSPTVDTPAVPHGKVYKLHLRQNGAERWLQLWGPFESVESARAARDEIAAQGAMPGWPRRIAPLQAEARNIRD